MHLKDDYQTSGDMLFDRLQQIARAWMSSDAIVEALVKPVLEARNFDALLAAIVSNSLSDERVLDLNSVFRRAYEDHAMLVTMARRDLEQTFSGEAAVADILTPLLFFPGFHALQTHRLAHRLWQSDRGGLAHYLQSLSIRAHGADIHPGAQIEPGVVISHSNGIVIGETAEIGGGAIIRQNVTLGSKYRRGGPRHPIIGADVTIGAGATVLGRITIGAKAVIGAGAVVVHPVATGETVVGFAARPTKKSDPIQETRTSPANAVR